MNIKPLTEHHLKFLSLKGATQARLNLYLSKCLIVGSHMSRLICKIDDPNLIVSNHKEESISIQSVNRSCVVRILASSKNEPRHVISNNAAF